MHSLIFLFLADQEIREVAETVGVPETHLLILDVLVRVLMEVLAHVVVETVEGVETQVAWLKMNKNILYFSLVTFIAVLLGHYFYLSYITSKKITQNDLLQNDGNLIIEYSTENTPNQILEISNKDYAEAIAFEKSKKYDLALSGYKKSLLTAQDKIQETQILLKIALINEWLGNYTDSIKQLKSIISNVENYDIARAYAVQQIGFMNIYTQNKNRQEIFNETFKDLPFESFVQEDNLNLTYTRLFEYAANIYPLGYSMSYVAYGYSGEIINTLNRATTTPQAVEYISRIQTSLKYADEGIERMKKIPGEAGLVPTALAWEGVALSRLAAVGVVDKLRPEPYFEESISYAKNIGDRPGSFNTFNYAAFLTYHYGDARKDDIKTILHPFRTNNDSEIYPIVEDFFKEARIDKNLLSDKKQIIFMSKIDTEFKEYLNSLGWEETDFIINNI